MTGAVDGLFSAILGLWKVEAIVFLRISAAMSLLPALGERSIPQRVRLAIAVLISLVVSPAVYGTVANLQVKNPLMLLFSEVVTGLALGFLIRIFVLALQTAGIFAAQSMSLSQVFAGDQNVDPQPAISHLMIVAGVAFLFISNLHISIIVALADSYSLFPPGEFIDPRFLTRHVIETASLTTSLAFSIAAPFVLASLIYNLSLGALSRAMPQLMVVLVGAPLIAAFGLALSAVLLPELILYWAEQLQLFLQKLRVN